MPKDHAGNIVTQIEPIRSAREEKGQQIANVALFVGAASAANEGAKRLGSLQKTARGRQNVFAALMKAVKTHSLGQISHALY